MMTVEIFQDQIERGRGAKVLNLEDLTLLWLAPSLIHNGPTVESCLMRNGEGDSEVSALPAVPRPDRKGCIAGL